MRENAVNQRRTAKGRTLPLKLGLTHEAFDSIAVAISEGGSIKGPWRWTEVWGTAEHCTSDSWMQG